MAFCNDRCTRTEREDSDDERMSDGDSDDDENDIPYNPKNLPLGWDGKVWTMNIQYIFYIPSCFIAVYT